jgi:BASS family bile acid:Na+ symporter
VVLIPLVLLIYASALQLEIPRENIIATLVILLVPVGVGMMLRKINANWGAVTEFMGSMLALIFILLLLVTWVPRNWQFLLSTSGSTYFVSIMLGVFGISCQCRSKIPQKCRSNFPHFRDLVTSQIRGLS